MCILCQLYLLDTIAAIVLLLTVCILSCTVLRVHLQRRYWVLWLGILICQSRVLRAVESIVKLYVRDMSYNLTVYTDGG